jgi:hypothetical protein
LPAHAIDDWRPDRLDLQPDATFVSTNPRAVSNVVGVSLLGVVGLFLLRAGLVAMAAP